MLDPPEDHRFDDQQLGIGRNIHINRSRKARAVEQDRFLRQPGKEACHRGFETDADPRDTFPSAIDFFSRLGGHHQLGLGFC